MAQFKWWGNNDSLFGGETFRCVGKSEVGGVKRGDEFRLEKRGKSLTMIPNPKNNGTWDEAHSKTHPIVLTKFTGAGSSRFKRVFSMMVTVTKNAKPKQRFLVEGKNGTIAIAGGLGSGGGSDDGMAEVQR